MQKDIIGKIFTVARGAHRDQISDEIYYNLYNFPSSIIAYGRQKVKVR